MAVPNKPSRVLVAGAGSFGREHLSRLAGRTDVEIAGIADPNAAVLDRVRQQFSMADCRPDALELMRSVPADAVIIASSSVSHVPLAKAALERGLCVLLEKPVARSARELEPLLAASRQSGGVVLPGHVLRFSKDHGKLVEIVRSGRIGRLLYVNSRRYRDETHATGYPDTDPVFMTLVHDIDLTQWITGSTFHSVRARRTGGLGFRSITTASIMTSSGVICDLRTAWTFLGTAAPPDLVEAVGDRGSVELTAGAGLCVWDAEGRTDVPLVPADDPLANEHEHFLTCVKDRAHAPMLGLTEAMTGLLLADASLVSIAEQREVEVRE